MAQTRIRLRGFAKLKVLLLLVTLALLGLNAPVHATSIIGSVVPQLVSDGYTPPDVTVGIGPTRMVEMTNLQIEIAYTSGVPISKTGLSNFFCTGGDQLSDPKVVYDTQSGRWFSSILDLTKLSIVLAVSGSSDPSFSSCTSGQWWFYTFNPGGGDYCPDQPILGVTADKVTFSVNNFPAPCGSSTTFQESDCYVFHKQDLTSHVAQSKLPQDLLCGTHFSMHPAQNLDSSSTLYFVSTDTEKLYKYSNGTGTVSVMAVDGYPPNALTVRNYNVPVRTINQAPSAPQRGYNVPLSTADYRVLDAKEESSYLWFTADDSCTPSGDTQSRSCARTIELSLSIAKVTKFQDFDISQSGWYYFYPALSIDASGNVVIVFGNSNSANYPSLYATSQKESVDKLNTWETPQFIAFGAGPVGYPAEFDCLFSCRYGDYFGAATNPSNTAQIVVGGEYGLGQNEADGDHEWATATATVSA